MKTDRSTNIAGNRRGGRAGFTLIEVAMAAAVAALVMAGMFKGYNVAARRAQFSACSMAANSQAMRHLEQVVSANWVPTYGVTQLLSMNSVQTGDLCLPSAMGNVVNCTNVTTVTQVSTMPPYAMIRVDCIWTFPSYGGVYTNTIAVLRAPNL